MIKLDLNPARELLVSFGRISVVGFPLVGFVLSLSLREAESEWWTAFQHPVFLWLLGVGIVTFVLSFVQAALIRPIYIALMIIAVPIGFVVSNVVIGAIYYLMITPLGLVFRLFGRDPLNKKPDPSVKSYWHVRDGAPDPASYLKQY